MITGIQGMRLASYGSRARHAMVIDSGTPVTGHRLRSQSSLSRYASFEVSRRSDQVIYLVVNSEQISKGQTGEMDIAEASAQSCGLHFIFKVVLVL